MESWVAPPLGQINRSVHVYTNAPRVRLWLNGVAVAEDAAPGGVAAFGAVTFAPGNLTAEALDVNGARLRTDAALTPVEGGAVALSLSLDAPSPRTGTGAALVADGQDVAMVRTRAAPRRGQLALTSP